MFEFTPGGRWKYDMHGPKGARYPNESVFLELVAPSKHLPWKIIFRLKILAPQK